MLGSDQEANAHNDRRRQFDVSPARLTLIFIGVLILRCRIMPDKHVLALHHREGHFRPFTGVMREIRREVTRKMASPR